jgi:Tfp pilus assembly PilM family ATPase
MLIPPPYAIDLGDRSVKVAQLVPRQRWHAGYPAPRARFLIERNLQEGWMVNGAIADLGPLAAFLRRTISERVPSLVRSPFVIATIPEQRTFLTTTTLPHGGGTPRDDAIHRAVSAVLPIDVRSATVASAPIAGVPGRVAIAAAPTSVVESHAALYERMRITPLALVPEAEALARAVAYTSDNEPIRTTRNSSTRTLVNSSLVLDLGATRTGAILANGQSVAASVTIPVSGERLTAAIAAKLRIEPAAAERAKRNVDISRAGNDDPAAAAVVQALEPLINGVASLRSFAQHHLPTPLQPKHIVLAGGGAALHGLDAFLKQRCKLDVTTFALPATSTPRSRTAAPTTHLALVFGLGLMALDPASVLAEDETLISKS